VCSRDRKPIFSRVSSFVFFSLVCEIAHESRYCAITRSRSQFRARALLEFRHSRRASSGARLLLFRAKQRRLSHRAFDSRGNQPRRPFVYVSRESLRDLSYERAVFISDASGIPPREPRRTAPSLPLHRWQPPRNSASRHAARFDFAARLPNFSHARPRQANLSL